MDDKPTPEDPDEVERLFAEMLDEAGLPRFDSSFHDPELNELQLIWDHGLTIHIDLMRDDDMQPIDEFERSAILGHDVVDVIIPGDPSDPRSDTSEPGIAVHRVPELHPDDVTVVNGIPVTSPSRTLIDCAEILTQDELREMFMRARETGKLDPEALRAARGRVEWRPSLAMLDEVIAEFCG